MIDSRKGVKQGDLLGPALIFLTIYLVVKHLQFELCISYQEGTSIGQYWEDIVHDFQRVGESSSGCVPFFEPQ